MGQRQVTGRTRRISRRDFGRRAGAAATLAAAQAFAPFLFVG